MNSFEFYAWLEKKQQCPFPQPPEKPLIMGILNVTQDSFSDGGCYLNADKACQHAEKLIQQGADMIDVGGESTRPGAKPVSVEEELARVIPVLEKMKSQSDQAISIDTSKPEVMRAAVAAGACMINDVSALRADGALALATTLDVPVCLMHMQGSPADMQDAPIYTDGVIAAVEQFFTERLDACERAGMKRSNLLIDPGFGFGKTVDDNMKLLRSIARFQQFQQPILIGTSRKSSIGHLLEKKIDERLYGSLASAVYCAGQGVSIVRVHDVDETNQALTIIDAIYRA